MTPFDLNEWSMVPGPKSIRPPFHHSALVEFTIYGVHSASDYALAVPGVQLLHAARPDWFSWHARWTGDAGAYIDITMDMEDAPLTWGAFAFSGAADARQFLDLFVAIHARMPFAWLRDRACELHTADSFCERFAIP